ncbi:NDP-hexose 2,3-dehydratase family protein [Actinoplanes sp. NPDC049548]|uniref:NDP-hexose 2,3-dehydratase family protein n=1 Tax=Actinoplanes sp. NPDC049548 TaxID=3155152 RepID=UPI003448825A
MTRQETLRPTQATDGITQRIARSALTPDSPVTSLEKFHRWYDDRQSDLRQRVTRAALDDIRGWHFDEQTGDLRHVSGRFFAVEGVHVRSDAGPIREWTQPIINQPEIGILGILVRNIGGVLHCLMQAKVEPGNCNGVQLSPTIQATKSNYTGVHGGQDVPYLEHFRNPAPGSIVADVLQSEQGAWFYRKRNRNMIVEVGDEVEARENFCWLTLGQLRRLLDEDHIVNMDSRTVLCCLPIGGAGLREEFLYPDDGWHASVVRSLCGDSGSVWTTTEILSWITENRSRHEVSVRRIPLREVRGWTRSRYAISHDENRFFSVMAVDVEASGREVASWSQPLIEPHGTGTVAFLVRRIGGVLHALVHAKVEPGFMDVVELAPTVQYTPENYAERPDGELPPFFDLVRDARPEQIRFDTELSEEGGRFYRARNRYLVVEVDEHLPVDVHQDYRWMTLFQLDHLLRHSHYVNVEARTLISALRLPV